jgi:hypothetical protein
MFAAIRSHQGSSGVLLRKKGTWGGPAGGVERTRSTGAGDRPVRAVGTPGFRPSDARAFQPPPDPRHLRWVPPPTAGMPRRVSSSAAARTDSADTVSNMQLAGALVCRLACRRGLVCRRPRYSPDPLLAGPAVSSSGRARGPTIPIHWQVPLDAFVLAPSDDTSPTVRRNRAAPTATPCAPENSGKQGFWPIFSLTGGGVANGTLASFCAHSPALPLPFYARRRRRAGVEPRRISFRAGMLAVPSSG